MYAQRWSVCCMHFTHIYGGNRKLQIKTPIVHWIDSDSTPTVALNIVRKTTNWVAHKVHYIERIYLFSIISIITVIIEHIIFIKSSCNWYGTSIFFFFLLFLFVTVKYISWLLFVYTLSVKRKASLNVSCTLLLLLLLLIWFMLYVMKRAEAPHTHTHDLIGIYCFLFHDFFFYSYKMCRSCILIWFRYKNILLPFLYDEFKKEREERIGPCVTV